MMEGAAMDTAMERAQAILADDPEDAGRSKERLAAGRGDSASRIIEALRTVYDPEIPVNIYELGPDLQDRHRGRRPGRWSR